MNSVVLAIDSRVGNMIEIMKSIILTINNRVCNSLT